MLYKIIASITSEHNPSIGLCTTTHRLTLIYSFLCSDDDEIKYNIQSRTALIAHTLCVYRHANGTKIIVKVVVCVFVFDFCAPTTIFRNIWILYCREYFSSPIIQQARVTTHSPQKHLTAIHIYRILCTAKVEIAKKLTLKLKTTIGNQIILPLFLQSLQQNCNSPCDLSMQPPSQTV